MDKPCTQDHKIVNSKLLFWCLFAACSFATAVAQSPAQIKGAASEAESARAATSGPVGSDMFRTEYIRLGSNNSEGLLYTPSHPGTKARIALVYSHPDSNNFNSPIGRELSSRGYRVLMVNYRGADTGPESFAPTISRGIEYVRSLPGVQKVLIIGHSGGGHLLTFYGNAAEHGPAACQDKQKVYPCNGARLGGLAKPDGIILLDPALGALHKMSSLDPAVNDKDRKRDQRVDMFDAANGYGAGAKSASYSAQFAEHFYAAQAARNALLVQRALDRLQAIEQGSAQFTDDEPYVIAGMSATPAGARLYQPDVTILAHTKSRHILLKADGSSPEVIVPSVRPASGEFAAALGSLAVMGQNTTVRHFLANDAIRTTPGYAFTADDILGVQWTSSMASAPGNAEGITVPALVMVMTCHYLVVPGEIIFNHLGSKDKTFAGVEGAVHGFTPCRPEYGDTEKRLFDYVDTWLSGTRRFN
jgi:pimeloyl-ACP methyl ester carboxylesterase